MKNLRGLYDCLLPENKTRVCQVFAAEYGLSVSSVRSNWFSVGKIPKYCMERAHEVLINAVIIQNQKAEKLLK